MATGEAEEEYVDHAKQREGARAGKPAPRRWILLIQGRHGGPVPANLLPPQ